MFKIFLKIGVIVAGIFILFATSDSMLEKAKNIQDFFGAPPKQQKNESSPKAEKYDNLSVGIPGQADTIIDRPGYALGYIEYHEQPAWVQYKLTKEEVKNKISSRTEDFREDPEIPTGSATLEDYRRSGYDRGHLAPAADMGFSKKTMSDSFYMSNVSPQEHNFNAGIWCDLEKQVRTFAITEGEIYVVTGPLLPYVKNKTIGKNKVTVPEYYYKVIYDTTPPCKMIGFLMPNKNVKGNPQEFIKTVDEIEEITGLNFFNTVEDEDELENKTDINQWKWNRTNGRF